MLFLSHLLLLAAAARGGATDEEKAIRAELSLILLDVDLDIVTAQESIKLTLYSALDSPSIRQGRTRFLSFLSEL